MIEIKTEWTKENLTGYVLSKFFIKNSSMKLAASAFAVCIVLIIASCIVSFLMLGDFALLFLAFGVIVLAVGYVLFLAFALNKYVKKALEANEKSEMDGAIITEDNIIACCKGEPFGEMLWEKITEIIFNDKRNTVYLSTDDGAVLILEYSKILKGTEKELREIVTNKYEKLPDKSKLSKKA